MSTEENVYGYINEEEYQSKDYAVFGLNQNVEVKSILYVEKSQNENEYDNTFVLTVDIKGQEFRLYISKPTFAYVNGNKVEEGDEGYEEAIVNLTKSKLAMITHIVKALGVTTENLKKAFKTPARNFSEWVERILSLLPKTYPKVDIFLEYQWNIKEGNNRTFLQIPKTMAGGKWICTYSGNYKPVTSENGELFYLNEKQEKHLFVRNKSFMESNKAKQQTLEEEDTIDKIEDSSSASSVW